MQSLRVLPVHLDPLLGYFPPLLKELNIVLLCLLFYEFGVLVHLPHEFDEALLHLLHVALDLENVLFGELDGQQVLLSTVVASNEGLTKPGLSLWSILVC